MESALSARRRLESYSGSGSLPASAGGRKRTPRPESRFRPMANRQAVTYRHLIQPASRTCPSANASRSNASNEAKATVRTDRSRGSAGSCGRSGSSRGGTGGPSSCPQPPTFLPSFLLLCSGKDRPHNIPLQTLSSKAIAIRKLAAMMPAVNCFVNMGIAGDGDYPTPSEVLRARPDSAGQRRVGSFVDVAF